MAGMTSIDQQQIRNLATRHVATADGIDKQRTLLGTHIDTIAATNHSAMINALKDAHNQWDEQVREILKTLRQMADSVNQVVAGLDSGDTDNASNVQAVSRNMGSSLGSFLGQ
jgi:hypothetical protein